MQCGGAEGVADIHAIVAGVVLERGRDALLRRRHGDDQRGGHARRVLVVTGVGHNDGASSLRQCSGRQAANTAADRLDGQHRSVAAVGKRHVAGGCAEGAGHRGGQGQWRVVGGHGCRGGELGRARKVPGALEVADDVDQGVQGPAPVVLRERPGAAGAEPGHDHVGAHLARSEVEAGHGRDACAATGIDSQVGPGRVIEPGRVGDHGHGGGVTEHRRRRHRAAGGGTQRVRQALVDAGIHDTCGCDGLEHRPATAGQRGVEPDDVNDDVHRTGREVADGEAGVTVVGV